MPLVSYGFTFLLTRYWVPQGIQLEKSVSSTIPRFQCGGNCLTEGHIILYVNKIYRAVPRGKQWFPDINWVDPFTSISSPAPHSMNSYGYCSLYSGVFMKPSSGNLPRFWKKEKLFSAEHLVCFKFGACESQSCFSCFDKWWVWGRMFAGFMKPMAPSAYPNLIFTPSS